LRSIPTLAKYVCYDYAAIQDVGLRHQSRARRRPDTRGVTQGLGWALYERIVYDENGQLLT